MSWLLSPVRQCRLTRGQPLRAGDGEIERAAAEIRVVAVEERHRPVAVAEVAAASGVPQKA